MGAKSLIFCLLLSVASARRTQRRSAGANEGGLSRKAEAAAAVAKDAPAKADDPEEGALTRNSAKAAECSKALDLYFVIGCGLSCPDVENWNKMKGFVMHIANQFRITSESMRASVVQWMPEGAEKKCAGVTSQEELLACLENAQIKRGHSGHVDKALKIVSTDLQKGSSDGRQKYVIVLVDERNHYGGTTGHKQNVEKACNNDHCIISIAIGDDAANWNLVKDAKALASVPEETAFHAPTYEDLGNMVQPVLDLVCPGTRVHGVAPQVSSPAEPEPPAVEEGAGDAVDAGTGDMFASSDDW